MAALAAAGCDSTSSSSGPVPPTQPLPEIKMLSNRADMISGGDALVELVLPPGATAGALHVTVGPPGKPEMATDMSDRFTARPDGRLIGLINGLAEGANVLSADLGTGHGVFLKITNHNIGGPIFSGPHVTPFICATPDGKTASDGTPTNPSGLSGTASSDGQCNIATEARLFYRSNAACTPAVAPQLNPDPVPGTAPAGTCYKPYNPASPPADLAMTTTDAGVTMPFIVRVERGTLNRGIYDIAVLFDPTKDDVKTGWKPIAPQAGWNGKVLYSFGASSGHPRQQIHSEVAWADAGATTNDVALGKGFLVAVNSMTDSLYNDNRVLMTETLMMMKEKIIDTYGEVKYVMGNGCSGGSINQLTAASIFPGLLDGIQPTCTYPDSETTAIEVSDCALLVSFYNSPAWTAQLTADGINASDPTQFNPVKAAINGHLDQGGCHAWVNSFANLGHPGLYVPTFVDNTTGKTASGGAQTNNCSLPNSMVYDPVANPKGLRCAAQDNAAAIFGTVDGVVKDTKRGQTTVDNTGIQYGLKAFLAGKISAEMFVVLNENVGGVDADDNFTAAASGAQVPFARSVADAGALATAYRAGIVGDGAHWAQTPIIDIRSWDEQQIHHVWRSFALRARLDTANGNHANHVMWRIPRPFLVAPQSPDPAIAGLTLQSFAMMDKWLIAMKADATSTTIAARIAAARPTGAFDFCAKPIDATHSTEVTDFAVCDADPTLVPHSSPRQVAGGPVAENVLKCQLRPLNRADYNPVGLTDDQFNRLKAVFPDGVCDFTRPGVGQQPAVGPLDFSAGPGGVPFADAPQQQPF